MHFPTAYKEVQTMSNHSCDIVIGIDGGGTHTRVMAVDMQGNVLSFAVSGASSIHKDLEARRNVHSAIKEAVEQAGRELHHVRALVGGLAGYESEADHEWVLPLTDVEGLNCPKWSCNDSVIAHTGALMFEPGIIVVSGTGSILYAVTEDGVQIRNKDLHHYAASAARSIVYDACYEILAGNTDDSDRELVEIIFDFWNLSSRREFAQIALNGFVSNHRERNRLFALLAPDVTKAALGNSRLAKIVCDRAIHQITVGVELLGSYFSEDTVKVGLIGSVVNSTYFNQQLCGKLKHGNNKRYQLMPSVFTPVAGAVLIAFQHLNISIDEELIYNLKQHTESIPG
jgi:glucosamine kinase